MIGYIIFFIFVFIISLFVYIEYKNEKKYQEERRNRRPDLKRETKELITKPKKVPSAKEIEEQEKTKKEKQRQLEEKRFKETKLKETKLEKQIEKIDLPECNYPKFDHSRLMDMGLSPEEAREFVEDLIPQLESQIPLLKEALEISDFEAMERLTHSIKGSSMTVGTGGVSDLLSDYNTYLKTGAEPAIAEAYLEHLKHYYKELKEQYS